MQLWKIAWSTLKEEFIHNMKKLIKISSDVARALMAYPSIHGFVPILVVDVSVEQLITISLKVSMLG